MNEMYEKTGSTDEPDRGFMLHACMPRGMLNESFSFPPNSMKFPPNSMKFPPNSKSNLSFPPNQGLDGVDDERGARPLSVFIMAWGK